MAKEPKSDDKPQDDKAPLFGASAPEPQPQGEQKQDEPAADSLPEPEAMSHRLEGAPIKGSPLPPDGKPIEGNKLSEAHVQAINDGKGVSGESSKLYGDEK